VRDDLQGILRKGETVLYNADHSQSAKKGSVFRVELGLSLFMASFFIIATICAFLFGFAHGESLTSISAKSLTPALWLIAITAILILGHRAISKNLKLTSAVITECRLFMAPPANYVLKAGWDGPKAIADIVFIDQLSAVKGIFAGSSCLIFTSLNPFFNASPDQSLPTRKRYIPFVNVDEAFEHLPAFLKNADMQFEEKPAETATQHYKRAVDFLARRKARLG
jgi:hypothetical protein